MEINKTKNQKTTETINETKNWFSENINQTDKPLARLFKEKEREESKSEMKENLERTP